MITRSILVVAACAAALLAITLPSDAGSKDSKPNPRVYITDNLVITMTDSDNTVYAYSDETEHWTSHTFPKGLKVNPVLTQSLCAFSIEGNNINELVAVDQRGTWHKLQLSDPTSSAGFTYVDGEIAVTITEGHLHAFSALTGTWDTVKAPGAYPVMNDHMAAVTTRNLVAAFGAESGKWVVQTIQIDD